MSMKVYGLCRLVGDPEVRYSAGDNAKAVARFRVACNRVSNGQQVADFFTCKCFGKQAEFVEKYLHKGTKILLEGELREETYKTREGNNASATVIYVDSIEFAESKSANKEGQAAPVNTGRGNGVAAGNGFMNIPEGIEDEFPFPCN